MSPAPGDYSKSWWEQIWEALAGAMAVRGLPAGASSAVITLPTGYRTPEPPPCLESRSIDDCEPELRDRIIKLMLAFKREQGKELFITCSWRSTARQQELYQQGRVKPGYIVTNIDGIKTRSRHNYYPSQAVDVCVDDDLGVGKHPVWDIKAYMPLEELCQRFGLVWGGSWKHLKDYPHIEMKP